MHFTSLPGVLEYFNGHIENNRATTMSWTISIMSCKYLFMFISVTNAYEIPYWWFVNIYTCFILSYSSASLLRVKNRIIGLGFPKNVTGRMRIHMIRNI